MKQLCFFLSLALVLISCQNTGSKSGITNTENHNKQKMELTNKDNVKSFLSAVNAADPEKAGGFLTEEYIQHNPFIPTGKSAFLSLFPVLKENGTRAESIRVLEDGNYVVLHNIWHNATPFGAPTMVSFDVIRLDENGALAEHWDAMMPQSPANASGRTLTDGPVEVTDLDKTSENKAKVQALFESLINGNPEDLGAVLPKYFDAQYHQHNPNAEDGIQGLASAIQKGELVFSYSKQHKVLGEGNFVLSISEGTHKGNPAVLYDLLRFENGMIVEHWDVIQDIPTENLANNNTMFNF